MAPAQIKQQKMAQTAYQCVQSVVSKGTEEKKEDYSNLAKRFPALVQACGLAQTLAFVEAKQKSTDFLTDLVKVMGSKEDLVKASREVDLMKYQRLSSEAIDASTWLKRYSEALLDKDEKRRE